jgi:hypothetical protein
MEFEELRSDIGERRKRLPQSSGENLSGMLFDCAYAVDSSRLFEKIKAVRTGDPYRLVEVRCQTQASSEEVIREIEEIWQNQLRYQKEPETHCLTVSDGKVTFNGVTEATKQYYVTVQIVVTLL